MIDALWMIAAAIPILIMIAVLAFVIWDEYTMSPEERELDMLDRALGYSLQQGHYSRKQVRKIWQKRLAEIQARKTCP